jgi:Ion channel
MSVTDSILRTVFSIADWRSNEMTERVRLRYSNDRGEFVEKLVRQTIGYGDIVPRQALARALAIGIGICGFFLTGLIAGIAVH